MGLLREESAGQARGEVGGMAPTPEPHNSITNTPECAWTATAQGQPADSSAGPELHSMGQQEIQSTGLLHSPRLMLDAPPKKDGVYRASDSALSPQRLSPQFSPPKPQTPVSPHKTLSGCEINCVSWPFKRAPVCVSGEVHLPW